MSVDKKHFEESLSTFFNTSGLYFLNPTTNELTHVKQLVDKLVLEYDLALKELPEHKKSRIKILNNAINYYKAQYFIFEFIHSFSQQPKKDAHPALKTLANEMYEAWQKLLSKELSKGFVLDIRQTAENFQNRCQELEKQIPPTEYESHAVLKNVLLFIGSILTLGIAFIIYLIVTSESRQKSDHMFFKDGDELSNPARSAHREIQENLTESRNNYDEIQKNSNSSFEVSDALWQFNL